MAQMIEIRFYSLAFVFFLCFSSFLAGWLVSVFIPPGNLSPIDQEPSKASSQSIKPAHASLRSNAKNLSEKQAEKEVQQNVPFFEEMRNNIMILFDPYKMDSLVKQHTYLEKKGSFIKNRNHTQIPFKIQPSDPTASNDPKPKYPFQNFNKLKRWPLPSLEESPSLEALPKTKEDKDRSTLQKLQTEYDKKNRDQLSQIFNDQKFFTADGQFSFLVKVFSKQDKALDYVQDMKKKYPLWSFLIKAHKDHIRIYLGPFPSKEKALAFKEAIPFPFSPVFLEEVSL